MELKKIEEILERYWNVEATEEEELILKNYFQGDEVAEHLKDVGALFGYYEVHKSSEPLDEKFDEELLEKIHENNIGIKIHYQPSMFSYLWRIAAAFAIIIASVIIFSIVENKREKQLVMSDTYEDPEKAYEVTRQALMILSKNLNKGNEYVSELSKFDEIKTQVEHNLK